MPKLKNPKSKVIKKLLKEKKKPLKKWNVFYTQPACQYEVTVEAATLKQAVKKVRDVLTDSVESIEGGWQILSDKEYKEKYGKERLKP